MPEHAVRGVYAESRDVPLWDRLAELQCPVLVVRGGRRGSLVTDELAQRWQASLPSARMAVIASAGHDLWSRDPEAYLAVLLPFLELVALHPLLGSNVVCECGVPSGHVGSKTFQNPSPNCHGADTVFLSLTGYQPRAGYSIWNVLALS
jgi:hypothetical protein